MTSWQKKKKKRHPILNTNHRNIKQPFSIPLECSEAKPGPVTPTGRSNPSAPSGRPFSECRVKILRRRCSSLTRAEKLAYFTVKPKPRPSGQGDHQRQLGKTPWLRYHENHLRMKTSGFCSVRSPACRWGADRPPLKAVGAFQLKGPSQECGVCAGLCRVVLSSTPNEAQTRSIANLPGHQTDCMKTDQDRFAVELSFAACAKRLNMKRRTSLRLT